MSNECAYNCAKRLKDVLGQLSECKNQKAYQYKHFTEALERQHEYQHIKHELYIDAVQRLEKYEALGTVEDIVANAPCYTMAQHIGHLEQIHNLTAERDALKADIKLLLSYLNTQQNED